MNGPNIEVFEHKPEPVDTTDTTDTTAEQPPTEQPPAEQPRVKPIPRKDLVSAGSARTDEGWIFSNPTYFENPLVFVVTEDEGEWLQVMIPARPNNTHGWIRASDVTLSEHRFHMRLTLSAFELQVWEGDDPLVDVHVVIGTDHTPTPTGNFYVGEKIEQSYPGGAYGPWILATSGYSEALDMFDGGLPVIAMHGTNQPQLLGSKSSNGCIRIPNDVITRLAEILPAGTPLEIVE